MSIKTYLQETKAELKQVKWPTINLTISVTIAVLVISAIVAIVLSLFDLGFAEVLKKVLGF